MKDLTIVILGKKVGLLDEFSFFEFMEYNGEEMSSFLSNIHTKYVLFMKCTDSIKNVFFNRLLGAIKKDFDCCFINYSVNYNYKNTPKMNVNPDELKINLPYYGSYIWSYVFKTELLLKLTNECSNLDVSEFNDKVKEMFTKVEVIPDPVYFHVIESEPIISLSNYFYTDYKETKYYKNIMYFTTGISGTFNGYVSWVRNIGKCFSKYDITLLCDKIGKALRAELSQYFNCVEFDNRYNYVCDRLLVTYSDYYYRKNVFYLDKNYLFIHGVETDYKNARVFHDDLYSEYIGVSKIAAEKAVGYYPTDHISCLYNPFLLDKSKIKPHLRLVSAMRSSDIKKPERIRYFASILDELDIPYTWNFFTDKDENTNKNGLVIRSRVVNPFPYIQDSDYFVMFSDSEALPYSIVEALSLNTKVLVTPLPAFYELGVVDGENGIIVPFDYFNEENKEKLKNVARRVYAEKEKTFEYEFDSSLYQGYNDIFVE